MTDIQSTLDLIDGALGVILVILVVAVIARVLS